MPDEGEKKANGENTEKDEGGGENPLSGAAVAGTWAKVVALGSLGVGLLFCVLGAGLAGWSHNVPFQTDANFALFAAFIVVAGAIERFMQPFTAVLPPFTKKDDPESKADRTLVAYAIALVVGIAVSALFGLYFLETVGVKIGTEVVTGDSTHFVLHGWDKALRGLDVFITALIITGGTKPLHDMITSIEKKKEKLAE